MSDPMTSTTAPVQQNYATDGTTISAAALATRIAALEAQIALAQRDNTKLIGRTVELEHERDRALLVVACAVALVARAEGLATMLGGPDYTHIEAGHYADLSRATAAYLSNEVTSPVPHQNATSGASYADLVTAPPRAHDPGRLCDHCTLPLVSAHIADETVITDGTRQAHVHHVCMSAYPGWTVVATARGGGE